MENLGIYEDSDVENRDDYDDDDIDQDESPGAQNPDEEADELPRTVDTPDEVMAAHNPTSDPAKQQKGKSKANQLELSNLDEKSVKIMVMLMVYLIQNNMTTKDFFREVMFEQNVKTKTKHFSMTFVKADDFFRVLMERQIRSKDTIHENLR